MSDRKFTPGPWVARERDVVKNTESGPCVIGVATAVGSHPEANAQMMSSAPELYRELNHLVRLLEPLEDSLRIPGLATLNAARAALAKAEAPNE